MNFGIYHNRDLDGLCSGALILKKWPEAALLGFDYGNDLRLINFENKDVIMADVTMNPKQMLELIELSKSFILVDHHVSFRDDFLEQCAVNGKKTEERRINGLITEYSIKGIDKFQFYYSQVLSAAEIMFSIYHNDGNEDLKSKVQLLGQYDTWRNNQEKMILNDDLDWDNYVLAFQYGLRIIDSPANLLYELQTSSNISIVERGRALLNYQDKQNESLTKNFSFPTEIIYASEDELKTYRVLALNSGPFNSNTFKSLWNPELYDIMMPFMYKGSIGKWTVSLYTDKADIDVSKIAKQYGGGGHKQAAGFQIDEIHFKDGKLILGPEFLMLDVAMLPKDIDLEELANAIKNNQKLVGLQFINAEEKKPKPRKTNGKSTRK